MRGGGPKTCRFTRIRRIVLKLCNGGLWSCLLKHRGTTKSLSTLGLNIYDKITFNHNIFLLTLIWRDVLDLQLRA